MVPRTPFNFTVGTTPVTVLAGSCSLPMTIPAGNLTITEATTSGLQVTDITVVGAGALVTKDLAAGKAHDQRRLQPGDRGGLHQRQAATPR